MVRVRICIALRSVLKHSYENSVRGKASTELAFPWYVLFQLLTSDVRVLISLELLDFNTKGLVVGVLQDLKLLFNVEISVSLLV